MEELEVFDRRNRRVGRASRSQIHRFGLMHRAAHILVFDPGGRLYLQLRRDTKDQYPGHWDSSAAGHVDPGEDYLTCARRELEEELGLQEDLHFVVQVAAEAATGWEHVVLFQCTTAGTPRPNPEEIAAGDFFTPEEVNRWLNDPDCAITPAFRRLWALWREGGGAPAGLNPGAPPASG